ncbi:DUF726-domain-containing protein [Basidiobolus meristosporus CBS 931.73]|uniref:DUF726-domain-containing protein n=1 Tax=Basidiobolus meristosporus CBS 931.73 TaxID=1314790 RepID=A0A1Y1YKQ4_9FUNG|nr:DUF726-domain-containing protein [Basidiobolus meristosporus CBS 931.73]|eukprot:ORX98585.1 DUF726-domain-containing protein [Basidiobolus meristosporus CBS 931.73]
MSEATSTDEPEWPVYFANTWEEADRFAVAVLLLISIEKLGKEDSEWLLRFRESVFHHFDITKIPALIEQEAILDVVFRELQENDEFVFETIASSLIPSYQNPNDSKKDIRKEILSDFLMICLGLFDTHQAKNSAEKSALGEHSKQENKVGEYDARSRSAIFAIAKLLQLPLEEVHYTEKRVSQELYFIKLSEQEIENNMDETTKSTIASHSKKNKKWRWIATGVSAVVGATAIGLTGGLAAPFVAAGISALGLGSAAFLASTAGVAVITSLFGIAGGGLAGFKVTKRMRNLREFYFKPISMTDPSLPAIPSLNATIVVSGYLRTLDDITVPWEQAFSNAKSHRDIFSLVFESGELLSLGSAFDMFLATEAAKFAATETLKRTVMATLMASMALPMSLIKAGDLIDNPWIVGIDRAKKAGLVLADVLTERIQGNRPASLVGFSLGALAIFECLLELSKRKKYGLIDEVILLGAPISIDAKRWASATDVVSRRFINGYSTKDWVLGFLFRLHNLNLNAAGLEPVNVAGVESIDLTELVNGHNGYLDNLDEILHYVKIDI